MTEIIRIPNIQNYTQEIINGELVLTPRENYITENEMNMCNFTNSSIIKCLIKRQGENISTKTRYQSILTDIWKSIPSQIIVQNTYFNVKLTNENGALGYNWCNDINMSFQGKDSNGTLKEIINMVKVNNMSINISIMLETGGIIYFKIE